MRAPVNSHLIWVPPAYHRGWLGARLHLLWFRRARQLKPVAPSRAPTMDHDLRFARRFDGYQFADKWRRDPTGAEHG